MTSVAIIGGGIVGTATAEWCRRAGFDVTIIDKLPAGDEGMTSYGNAGILAASSIIPVTNPQLIKRLPFYLLSKDSPLFLNFLSLPRMAGWLLSYLRHGSPEKVHYIAENLAYLLHDTVDRHFALAEGTGAEKYLRRSDYYLLFRDEAGLRGNSFATDLQASHGLVGDIVGGTALHDFDKNLGDYYQCAWRFKNHGIVTDPGGYVAALQRHFTGEGGKVVTAHVEDIIPLGDDKVEGRVEITGGDYRQDFDKCVIAGGVHSEKLAKRLGVRTTLQAETGYHIFLENPSFMPPAPLMLSDGKCVLTPMDKGLRLAGLVEFGYGEKGGNRQAAVDYLLRYLRQAYPSIEYSDYRVWRGHRPSTVDSLPLLGVHPQHKSVLFACGHQHIGLTASAKSGWLISRLLTGEGVNDDLSAFDAGRFNA